jgi:hypothetical protein
MIKSIFPDNDPSTDQWFQPEGIPRNVIPITASSIQIKKLSTPIVITDVKYLIDKTSLLKASQSVLEFLEKYAYKKGDNDPIIIDGNPYFGSNAKDGG